MAKRRNILMQLQIFDHGLELHPASVEPVNERRVLEGVAGSEDASGDRRRGDLLGLSQQDQRGLNDAVTSRAVAKEDFF